MVPGEAEKTERLNTSLYAFGAIPENELLRIKAEQNMTMVMVTHDVDEAVYLSNKIVVMSPRPAKIEEILEVHLSQPRDRNNPEFIRLRSEILKVLDFAGREKDVEYTI